MNKNFKLVLIIISLILFNNVKLHAAIESKYLLFCPFLADYIEENGAFKYDNFNTVYNGTDVSNIQANNIEPTVFNPLASLGVDLPYNTEGWDADTFLKSWTTFGIKSADYQIVNNSVNQLIINSVTCDPDAYNEYTKYGDIIAEVCDNDDLSFNDLFYSNIDSTTNNIEYQNNTNLIEKGFRRDSSLTQFTLNDSLNATQSNENQNNFKYGVIFFDFMDKITNTDKKRICNKPTYKTRNGEELTTYCNAPTNGTIAISPDSISSEVITYIGGSNACKLNLDFKMKVNSSVFLYNVNNLGNGYTIGYGTVKCERDENTLQPVLSVVQNDPSLCDVNSLGVFDPSQEPECNELCVYVGNSCPPLDISWGTGEICRGTLPFMIGNPVGTAQEVTVYSTNPRTTGEITYKCIATGSGYAWDRVTSGNCIINN